MRLAPVAAGLRKTIEGLAPDHSPKETDEAQEAHSADEHDQADVDDPDCLRPAVALLRLLLLHLCTDDVSTRRLPPNHILPITAIQLVHQSLLVMGLWLVLANLADLTVEVDATGDDADEGESEATGVEVVDRGEDQLSEAYGKAHD